MLQRLAAGDRMPKASLPGKLYSRSRIPVDKAMKIHGQYSDGFLLESPKKILSDS